MQLSEGTLFSRDRYKLIKLLGRGGFSEVWLVQDMRTKLEQALKVYAPGMGLDEDGIALFIKEFSLVYNFNHSNLLKPTYFDEVDNMPFLIMPYIKKGSTNKMIGKMDEDTAWRFFHDVASGLSYLHTNNPPIIHQDIKPDNIMIGDNNVFLITDFGISMQARHTLQRNFHNSQSLDFGGTIAYMGPERFGKMPAPVKASDIWALGATVFELMEGYAPFGPNGGLIQKSGADLPDLLTPCSDDLKRLIELCLHIETWNRPTADKIVEICDNRKNGLPLNFPEHLQNATPAGKPSVIPPPPVVTPPPNIIVEIDNTVQSNDEQNEQSDYVVIEKKPKRKIITKTIIQENDDESSSQANPDSAEIIPDAKTPVVENEYALETQEKEEKDYEDSNKRTSGSGGFTKTRLLWGIIAAIVIIVALGGAYYLFFYEQPKDIQKTPAINYQAQADELIAKGDQLFSATNIRNMRTADDTYEQARQLLENNGLQIPQHLSDQIAKLSKQIEDSVNFFKENADYYVQMSEDPESSKEDVKIYTKDAVVLYEKYLILKDDEDINKKIEKLKQKIK